MSRPLPHKARYVQGLTLELNNIVEMFLSFSSSSSVWTDILCGQGQ